jgi:hypothetical protein
VSNTFRRYSHVISPGVHPLLAATPQCGVYVENIDAVSKRYAEHAFYCGEMGRSDACKTRWGNCGETWSRLYASILERKLESRGERGES